MAYNEAIRRTNVESLIPEVVSREIIDGVPEQSIIMQMARKLPNMSTNRTRMPILAGLVQAYFVEGTNGYGDEGLKQTTYATWSHKFLDAAELAVIVPIPEAVLDDTSYDIWSEIKPRIVEAFGVKFDRAVLYGEDAPSVWPTDIFDSAVATAHAVSIGSGLDLVDDILGVDGLVGLIEDDGFDPTGYIAATRIKRALRSLRAQDGSLLFMRTPQTSTQYELDGVGLEFPKNGAIDRDKSLLFVGDWNQLVWTYRQDITYKILDQAVIQDNTGGIIFNLAQQDMVALRAVMRVGWQISNPINRMNPNADTRFPFGVLTPGGVPGAILAQAAAPVAPQATRRQKTEEEK